LKINLCIKYDPAKVSVNPLMNPIINFFESININKIIFYLIIKLINY